MIASRTDARLTPSDAASSRSAGRREPGSEFAARDQLRELIGDLAIETLGLDSGEGQR